MINRIILLGDLCTEVDFGILEISSYLKFWIFKVVSSLRLFWVNASIDNYNSQQVNKIDAVVIQD